MSDYARSDMAAVLMFASLQHHRLPTGCRILYSLGPNMHLPRCWYGDWTTALRQPELLTNVKAFASAEYRIVDESQRAEY